MPAILASSSVTEAHEFYESPLTARYASEAMRRNFSDRKKFTTWRALWIALAESQKELGLPITSEQIAELKEHQDDIDWELAARHEKELRHDVMAHVHTFGDRCPRARGILHLGATSCDITDNADLIVLRDGLALIRGQLVGVLRALRAFALEWKSLPVLGLTHLQPAQATTLGKRASLWLQDLAFNLVDLEHARGQLRFRGIKGTTGTQASFLQLFRGDHEKVRALDRAVAQRMGFERVFAVTGQTYPRQLDFRICQVLAGIAQSTSKFALDVRLLASRGELQEPFGKKQVGSSAMPWKRNPMKCERINALARHVLALLDSTAQTAAQQGLERTLDDSANRRLSLPEIFLATDAILELQRDVVSGLVVQRERIAANLASELPFLACEHLMMDLARAGGDRQELHERLRIATHKATEACLRGEPNPLERLLGEDRLLSPHAGRLRELCDPSRCTGRAEQQVVEYVEGELDPLLALHRDSAERSGRAEV